jgi:hypothetical protein
LELHLGRLRTAAKALKKWDEFPTDRTIAAKGFNIKRCREGNRIPGIQSPLASLVMIGIEGGASSLPRDPICLWQSIFLASMVSQIGFVQMSRPTALTGR